MTALLVKSIILLERRMVMSQSSKSNSKQTTHETTVKTKKSVSISYLLNILSFCAVIICGVALTIAYILGKCGVSASITGRLESVANAIGWIVLCILSFGYIKRRRRLWMWILWTVAVVAIITLNVLGILGL